MTILKVALDAPFYTPLDYLAPEGLNLSAQALQTGVRVEVPFRRAKRIGILMDTTHHSDLPAHKLKPAYSILDTVPALSPGLMAFNTWLSRYYHHPIGEVLMASLPKRLREGEPLLAFNDTVTNYSESRSQHSSQSPDFELNEAQQNALDVVLSHQGFNVFLLDGVTGSGKTEVYLRLIEHTLIQGKQTLMLIPEINLTPQTVSRLSQRFNTPVVCMHSRLTSKQRLNAWRAAYTGQARIILGTRSALFAPLETLGLIIIDEEHDSSFKQQSNLRYHARDAAIVRAKLLKIPIVLGSATPSLSSLNNSLSKRRYQHLKLPERTGTSKPPSYHVIDLRHQPLNQSLSPLLLEAIRRHLKAGQQVLLFINRRGYAPVWLCPECGWMATCPHCDAKLTVHQSPRQLRCHHCGHVSPWLNTCTECSNKALVEVGAGTERIAEVLTDYFPDYPLVRMDSDSTRNKGSLDALLKDIRTGKARLIIGTQMLAKGHHFDAITLTAILDADSGLYGSDFSAAERMGQLLVQVAGRCGRGDRPGEVYLQTYHPEHPMLTLLVKKGYPAYAQALLKERQLSQMPPFSYLAMVRAESKQPEHAMSFLEGVRAQGMTQAATETITFLGPLPAAMARRAGYHRAQLLMRASKRAALQALLSRLAPTLVKLAGSKVRWHIDIDPIEIL